MNWVIKRKWRRERYSTGRIIWHISHTLLKRKKRKLSVRSELVYSRHFCAFHELTAVISLFILYTFGNALHFHNCWKILRIYFTLRSIYLRLNECLEAFLFLKPITNCLGFRAKYPLISINYAILSQRPPHLVELKSPLKNSNQQLGVLFSPRHLSLAISETSQSQDFKKEGRRRSRE